MYINIHVYLYICTIYTYSYLHIHADLHDFWVVDRDYVESAVSRPGFRQKRVRLYTVFRLQYLTSAVLQGSVGCYSDYVRLAKQN